MHRHGKWIAQREVNVRHPFMQVDREVEQNRIECFDIGQSCISLTAMAERTKISSC